MPKKYKKYSKKPTESTDSDKDGGNMQAVKRRYGQSPGKERTPEQKREYLKLFLFLCGWFIFVFAIYMSCINLEFAPILYIYYGLGIALFLVWLIFNGGFKKIDADKYEKPDDMGYDEFCKFIEKLKRRQKRAKYFMILFIPFPCSMLLEYTMMVWGDKLAK
jgi:hypothetical protein